MRAILLSKCNEVLMMGYTQQPHVRFPEFVYAWFEPPKAIIEGLPREEKLIILDRANENRWCLYYGVKVGIWY